MMILGHGSDMKQGASEWTPSQLAVVHYIVYGSEDGEMRHGFPEGTEGKREGFLMRSRLRFAISALRIFSILI